jgi:hypothetical protein
MAIKLANHKRKSFLAERVQAILECRFCADDAMEVEVGVRSSSCPEKAGLHRVLLSGVLVCSSLYLRAWYHSHTYVRSCTVVLPSSD